MDRDPARQGRKWIYLAATLAGGGLLLLGVSGLERLPFATRAKGKLTVIATSKEELALGLVSASWLDEDNIAFQAKIGREDLGLYTWNIRDKPKIYVKFGKFSHPGYLCAENGRLNYSPNVDHQGPITILSGWPGHETQAALRPPALDRDFEEGLQVNQAWLGSTSVTGRRCAIVVDGRKAGRSWVANYSNDAYLDLGPRWEPNAVAIEAANGGRKISLPIPIADFDPNAVETPSWDGSFFSWPKSSLSGSGRARAEVAGYRIFRTGHFEKISVKNSPALWGGKFIPYRDGYLVVTTNGGMRGLGGAYLVASDELKKKIDGEFIAIALSPSGCRLAVADLGKTLPEQAHLKIIQLCSL
jgi:hypothetical protein